MQGNARIVSQRLKLFAKYRGHIKIYVPASDTTSESELIGIGIQRVELQALAWS